MNVEPHATYGSFAPGASPFRVKGTAYQELVRNLGAGVPGGMESVLAELDDPRAVEFFRQTFLASSRYDVLPLIDAGQIGARLAGHPYRAFVREGARRQARSHMNGVYRVLLRLASTRLFVERMPRIFAQYIEFGSFTGSLTAPGRYDGAVSGIPKPACLWLQSAIEGFSSTVLECAGGSEPSILFHHFEQHGEIGQMPIMTARVTMRWNEL